MDIFRSHRNTRAFARLFIVLMVLWQGAVVHHMSVTAHALESVSLETENAPSHLFHPAGWAVTISRNDVSADNHPTTPAQRRHCQFLDSITLAHTFVAPSIVAWSSALSVAGPTAVLASDERYSNQSVLDYAPSTSPPQLV